MDEPTRALVADDEPFVRMLMVETLEDAGYHVLEACDGVEALRLINDPDNIDLVVTDLNMPGCDGAEVAKRARERHPTVPVLFVSGRSDLIAASGAPAPYGSLPKPFTMTELERAVGSLLVPALDSPRTW
jgi:CheY-like chemotaxis protein